VLSTTWAPLLGLVEARSRLPREFWGAVVGSTFHASTTSGPDGGAEGEQDPLEGHGEDGERRYAAWWEMGRFNQIATDARRRGWNRLGWVALDDDDARWPAGERASLVHVDPVLSLARQPHGAHELVVKLAQLGRDDPQAAPQTLAGLPEWQVRPRRKRVAA
jgi:hypothetical protein